VKTKKRLAEKAGESGKDFTRRDFLKTTSDGYKEGEVKAFQEELADARARYLQLLSPRSTASG
jgi:cell division septum initiation protein DivIVA